MSTGFFKRLQTRNLKTNNGWMCWKKKTCHQLPTNFLHPLLTLHEKKHITFMTFKFIMKMSFSDEASILWPKTKSLFFFSSSLSVNVAVHGIPNTRRQLPSLQKWSTFKRFEASNARYQTTHFRGIRRITWYKYTAPFPDVFSLLGLFGHTKQTQKIAKNRSYIHFCPTQPKRGIGIPGSTTTATK